ncbi:MAG: FAD-dependent oxidoreductase [Alphaproteobacteria bacterium GM7ARS4]|nr:FAD-dependent oxidoreductase [Alphaproteobacteria bacterium GM7ARS4]
MRIAIVGGGITGLTATYCLATHHDVVLFEKNDYLGGHTRTIYVQPDHATHPIPVDTGFIVYNDRTYPLLTALFQHLHIKRQKSLMSFGATINDGWLEYSTKNLAGIFAQPSNLFRPSYLRMMRDARHFFRHAPAYMHSPSSFSIKDYLTILKTGPWFTRYFLLPMASAIWSCPMRAMLEFPASTFIRFFHNHGLLSFSQQPQWYTIKGGAHTYVHAMKKTFAHAVHLHPATHIHRAHDHSIVTDSTGQKQRFDHVVLACHADDALSLLETPTAQERAILSCFRYQANHITVHGDTSFMPRKKHAWASWVYHLTHQETTPSLHMSYWMNNLQAIDRRYPLFVTLNAKKRAHPTYDTHRFHHPLFDKKAIDAQAQLPALQGQNKTWYCGAYQRYGFHEDGVWSALHVVKQLAPLPSWLPPLSPFAPQR